MSLMAISLSLSKSDNPLVCLDISKHFLPRNWNQEPNDYKGNEDCAVIYTSGEYNDVNCASHAAAICEIEKQGDTAEFMFVSINP